jgi:signal transduction histidine kinase
VAGHDTARGGTITVRTAALAVPPRGHVTIRAAACPKGCDLLDKSVRLAGAPSIRVLRRTGDSEIVLHLDPLYGRVNHRTMEPCDEGVIGTHLCPACRTKLEVPERRCEACGASVFAVLVPGSGQVEWCSRKGCPHTRWDAMDARGPQAYAQIQVEDTGRGISAEEMNRIFEPFFSTKGTRGTGLGLAVTWGIVEGHGGAISVESELGQGTRFTVRLPFQVPESGGPETGRDPASGSRILMPDARGKAGSGPTAPVASRGKTTGGHPPAETRGAP